MSDTPEIVRVEVTERLENTVVVTQNVTTVEVLEQPPVEVSITTVGMQGPAGPVGETGPTGPAGPEGPGGAEGIYGSFVDTTTQLNSSTVNTMRLNTTLGGLGVTVEDDTKVTFAYGGTFNLQFSAQFDKTDSGDDTVEVWLAVNGSDVVDSNTILSLHGNDGKDVAAWNFVFDAEPGDFAELKWYSPDANMRILARPAQTTPPRPAVPSVILTVVQVMHTQVGPTGPGGVGVPSGGATGNVLVKASGGDYDTDWATVADIGQGVIASERYSYTQPSAATVWEVVHNLGRHPIVAVTDSAGSAVLGDIVHVSANETHLVFESPFSGTAEFI